MKIKKVTVGDRLSGAMGIMNDGVSLRYREIAERPGEIEHAVDLRRSHRPPKPAKNHPWRKPLNWNTVAKNESRYILTK